MVRFRIEIETVAGDPKAVNVLLKTDSNQPAEAEQESARRLLPALRDLLQTRFAQSDDSRQPVAEEMSPR